MDLPVEPDAILDVTAETCPMTYVRTRLALDRLGHGQLLQVRVKGADPERQVPASAARQGHAVLSMLVGEDGVTTLLIRKK